MAYDDRKTLIKRIEELRGGRRLITICNFDRPSDPLLPGLQTQLEPSIKEPLYRVLEKSNIKKDGIDLFLYTRGGDVNTVWPLVCTIKEYDPDFQVIVPFRAHSAGTLISFAGKKILMGPISELSPVDPSTGNQFNPPDPSNTKNRLGISVEDVSAYKRFVENLFEENEEYGEKTVSKNKLDGKERRALVKSFFEQLPHQIHPLALGNVQRVHLQIKKLAKMLLSHREGQNDLTSTINKFTIEYYSHLHMISRHEAKEILGESHVEFMKNELRIAADNLLLQLEEDFGLRKMFVLPPHMKNKLEDDIRFIGSIVESCDAGYVYETCTKVTQAVQIPPNVQVQVPPGQGMPLIKGLPRKYDYQIVTQGWVKNENPVGVTIE